MDRVARQALSRDLARLADGDRAAFTPVYAAAAPVVQALCGRMLAGPDAEDAAQQAMMRLFERVDEYDPARDALPWILAIAGNECRTLRRRQTRRREGPLVDDLPAEASPESAVIAADRAAAVEATLGSLGALDAETLRLALGLATGERPADATFRKRLERALVRARLAWEQRHG